MNPSVSGQNKPCNNFDCAYKKAENFLKQAAYQKALDNLDSAEGYLTDTNTKEKEQIKQLRRRLFVAIEKEKEEAKRARIDAIESQKETEIANAKLDALFKIALAEKTKAKDAEAKAKAVLDKIYFYDGKFGLAYQPEKIFGKESNFFSKYGFIDKNLKTKIKFIYEEAQPFDRSGFAKVKKGLTSYIIDTTGYEYQLATDLEQLNSNITALDLRDKTIRKIDSNILINNQLKVLLIGKGFLGNIEALISELVFNRDSLYSENNAFFKTFFNMLPIEDVPSEIDKLSNLVYLDLSGNRLKSLPTEMENLTKIEVLNLSDNDLKFLTFNPVKLAKIKSLNLSNNPIPKEEQEEIKKLLPTVK